MVSAVELQAMLDQAAEKGAKLALENVGLHDQEAGNDIRELRGLLDSWRETRKTVGNTIAKIVTTAILTALAAGFWMQWHQNSR